jgi:LacI family transcriptional regulator
MPQSIDPNDCSLIPDDEQGGRIAVEHLLASGRRRRIDRAHHRPATVPRRRRRAGGAEQAMRHAGLGLAGPGVLYGEWSEAWGRHATQVLLRSSAEVDAILCGSDQIARGVSDALRELGIAVPEQTAIVGFDNWDVLAPTTRPPLTTVDMNLAELGRPAADHLLAAIDGNPDSGPHQGPAASSSANPPEYRVATNSSRPRPMW